MKEKHFCRCCLSEECYKDMTNTYYIGNKTETYIEMLLNIFNINLNNNDGQRCLICEECVSKLRDAATFKKKVLDIQEALEKDFSWENIDVNIDTKTEKEDADYFDDFNDNISDEDFNWENFTQNDSQKGQVFFITLESNSKTQKHKTISNLTKTKSSVKDIENTDTNNKKSSVGNKNERLKKIITLDPTEKDTGQNRSTHSVKEKNEDIEEIVNESGDFNTLDLNEDDSDCLNTEALDSEDGSQVDEKLKKVTKSLAVKRTLKTKASIAKLNKEKLNKLKACSEEQLAIKHKSEDTMKLVQNSNLCLFRSLRNKFGCNFCKMKFPEFSQLKEHSLSHKNPRLSDLKRLRGLSCKNADISDLKCNLCSEKCEDLEYLLNHLKKEHDISFHGTEHYLVPYKFQDGYQCVLCKLKFNTYMRLSIHMNSHYTNNVCDTCGLSYINRSGLRSHVQTMHREKKCSRCPAIFLTNSSKIKHMKQAHGVRPPKRSICNICNKTFKYTYILDEHKILEHGFKRPAVSTCEECGKTFLTPLKLKTHVRSVHIKERKYPCTKCDMRFFTTCDRRRHERTHEDVRSFCCSYCDAKFKSKDSWRRHLKRQHGHVFESTVT